MRQTIGPGIFVSFAVGLGAVAGLFFAPKRREQLREEITQEAADGLDQARSASGKVEKRAHALADRASSEINGAVETGEKAYSNAKKV